MATPTVIYCSDGNRRFAEIAIRAGFRYGAQLPNAVYYDPYFVDQNWRKPNRLAYMDALAHIRPALATVLDLERAEQLSEVLEWAEEAAQYASEAVIVIPKVHGIIERLPSHVGNRPVRLGYSVPTRFAGTEVAVWEFAGWPVHLLGGSPQAQMRLARYMDVVSVDGNMHQLMAVRWCQFWTPGNARYAANRWWPALREANGGVRSDQIDLPYIAFERSCKNIMTAWKRGLP